MSNQKTGRPQSDRVHWARYDALPPALREVYQRAPYDMLVRDIARSLRGGASIASERAALIAGIQATVRHAIAKDWGPDHPNLTIMKPLRARR